MSVLDDPRVTPVEEISTRPVASAAGAWRVLRSPVGIAVGALLVVAFIVALTGRSRVGLLDPEAAGPEGGRALAQILEDRDVPVKRVARPQGGAAVTVFVPRPELVDPDALAAALFVEGSDFVLVGAPEGYLEVLRAAQPGLDTQVTGSLPVQVRLPGCELPEAVVAGAVRLGGTTYDGRRANAACFAGSGRSSLVRFERAGARVTLVGAGTLFTNRRLDEDGNAALALALLSQRDAVEWVLPRPEELLADTSDDRGVLDLLPVGVLVFAAQLLVVALLLALWRGRRLGPVVVESLPVVVRAAEAVEGRGRLYRAAGARDRAADVLRESCRDRIVRALGLDPASPRESVVGAVAARTRRAASEIDLTLYGPPPADDAGLVRLARGLDTLDSEVRFP